MDAAEQTVESRAVQWVEKGALSSVVRRMVKPAAVVLDVGCGIHPQTLIWPRVHLCLEVHDEYVQYLRERLAGSDRHLVLHSTWKDVLGILPDGSVDTVFALDFIEHLTKAEGLEFAAEAERVARSQVVIFTPLGFFPQSYESEDVEDRWGMHGGYWQTHRSGWDPEDFSEQWEIVACRDYHTEDQQGRLENPIGCMWAIRTLPPTADVPAVIPEMPRRLWRQTMIHRYAPSWARDAYRYIRRRAL